MKNRFFLPALLLALLFLLPCAVSETTETQNDPIIAEVNGEMLLTSAYQPYEDAYRLAYANTGYAADKTITAYVQDLALTAAIEDMLLEQDMTAQGCYAFDEETEALIREQGESAYESALLDVGEALRSTLGEDDEADMRIYAEAYAQARGVTVQDYTDVFRTQYARMKYNQWLTADQPITQEEVQAEYASRVAHSQALYENDVAGFETALSAGESVWYKPAGYRSILQILLPAEGDTKEEKLLSVQNTLQEIESRLHRGESFESLIAQYGTDSAFDKQSFYTTGYQVHAQSVIWDEAFVQHAFSAEMNAPGDWSQPFASDLGVHILYYLKDSESGSVELTDALYEALSGELYQARCQTLLDARIDALSDSAEVILY